MICFITVRRIGAGSLAGLMADARTWLDRNHIEAPLVEHSCDAIGAVIRVGFRSETDAVAFAQALGGHRIGDDPAGAALWQGIRPKHPVKPKRM